MDVISPFIPVFCHSDSLFHGESCPRLDVVHPGRAWPSSPSCTWHCSLRYLFLHSTPLFPHSSYYRGGMCAKTSRAFVVHAFNLYFKVMDLLHVSTNTVCATRVFVLQSLINGSVPSLSREAEVSRGGNVLHSRPWVVLPIYIGAGNSSSSSSSCGPSSASLDLTTHDMFSRLSITARAGGTHARTPPVKYLASRGRTDGTPPRRRHSQTTRRDCRPNVPGVQRVRRVRRTSASGSVREDVCNNSKKNRKKSRFSRF